MRLVNFYRKPISVFVMVTFFILLCFWANKASAAVPAPASEKNSAASLENKESESTGFSELEKSEPAIKKGKRFPWLLATLGIGVVVILVVLLSKKKTPVTPPAENMVLTINLGTGTTGTPAATASYNKDQAVNYSYTAQAGYFSLQVKLDGVVAPASGTTVRAGDVLGRLLLAPGNDIALLHFGVRWRPANRTDCPLDYCTAQVKAQLQALARRDHPGWEVCVGNGPSTMNFEF